MVEGKVGLAGFRVDEAQMIGTCGQLRDGVRWRHNRGFRVPPQRFAKVSLGLGRGPLVVPRYQEALISDEAQMA